LKLTTTTIRIKTPGPGPITGGRLALGRWQGVYLWEHRAKLQDREVVAQLLSDATES
jgi:thiamine phosphate synthase YjbQ (UPF0047 family)